jgi:DNA modification methylase
LSRGGQIAEHGLDIRSDEDAVLAIQPHPGLYPEALPGFAIKLTADKGDGVFDLFSGSCESTAPAKRFDWHFITSDFSYLSLEVALL